MSRAFWAAAVLALLFVYLARPTASRSRPGTTFSQRITDRPVSRIRRKVGNKGHSDDSEWDWEDDGGDEPPRSNPNEAGSGERCGGSWKRCQDGLNCTGMGRNAVCEAVLATGATCGATFTRCVPPSTCRRTADSRRCLVQVALGANCNSTTVCARGECSAVNRTIAICELVPGRI